MHTTFSHLNYELQNLSENDSIGVENNRRKPKMAEIGPCTKKRGRIISLAENRTISHSLHTTEYEPSENKTKI